MTTSTPATPDTSDVEGLVNADHDARKYAMKRADLCSREINEALVKHRCRIMPRIDPAHVEHVGVGGDKVMITATFWIAPLAP